jgi:hypothetical protein
MAVTATDEEAVLADRLRWAAESLSIEFQLPAADAERLIHGLTREFFSDAKVAQFVPTLAIRRARQLLRDGQFAGPPSVAPPREEIDLREPLEEVAAKPVIRAAPAPLRPLSDYAVEAKHLLDRAKSLRATAPLPPGRQNGSS